MGLIDLEWNQVIKIFSLAVDARAAGRSKCIQDSGSSIFLLALHALVLHIF